MSEDLERALTELSSAKTQVAVSVGAAELEPGSQEAGMADIASERILRRLQSPLSGRMGADYWSSIYADRAEAASVIELLRNELETARKDVEQLTRRLAQVERAYAAVAEALPNAERRGYDLAISQVFEALRRDPSANAASLILQVSGQEPPPARPQSREGDVWRALDDELNSLRRTAAARSDEAP